jgi:hypothetical protein
MANRKGVKAFIRPLLIVCSLLLSVSLVQAEPVSLGDSALDQVTAGTGTNHSNSSGSGGAIIGNSSEATITQTGGVTLEGEAQRGAKALNLVNSAESTVANGVNIWDAQGGVPAFESTAVSTDHPRGPSVEQSNIINQEQRRSASMPNYSRPEADTLVEVSRTGSEAHNNNLDRNNTVMDLHTLTSEALNTSEASVTTTISGGGDAGGTNPPNANIDTNVGKGIAIAGQLDTFIDGGEIQIGLAIGGAVVAQPDVITPTTGDRPNESFGGMVVGQPGDEATRSDFSLYGRVILPEIEIHINGAGCGVAMGSCTSKGTSGKKNDETIDKTIHDTEVSSSVGNSQYTEDLTTTYRSPFELNHAQAEYIVVDDSSLTVNTTFNLTLSGSAQSDVMGMNVVNATGSAVANGVNVARTGNAGPMGLKQVNVISHSR